MTQQLTNPSTITDSRCTHRFANGRRCRQLTTDPSGTFCLDHARGHAIAPPSDSVDFSADLIKQGDHFQEAQQINHSLIALYKLVAAGRISPRRASVLAHIAYLILNSLKAIDYDHHWYKKRLAGLPITPGVLALDDGPASATHPGPVGPGTEPLPDTADEFVAEVLARQPS